MENPLIYVIEDEIDLCDMICRKLSEFRLNAQGFQDGRAVRQALARQRPDLCIVDLMLPDIDGMELVRELAAFAGTGVIVVTARSDVTDRILGLEIGADDYIVKPFEPRELVARVHSLLRRLTLLEQTDPVGENIARFGDWQFDADSLTLHHRDGRSVSLGATEALLLRRFLKAPKRVLSREQLLDCDIDAEYQPFDRSIDIRISRLRRKIETDPRSPRLIKTVYGAGYLFTPEVSWLSGTPLQLATFPEKF